MRHQTQDPFLRLEGVSKSWPGVRALDDVRWTFFPERSMR